MDHTKSRCQTKTPKFETAFLLSLYGIDVELRPMPTMLLSEIYMLLNHTSTSSYSLL